MASTRPNQPDGTTGTDLLIAGRGNAARVTALALAAAGLPVAIEPISKPHDAPAWQSVLALSPTAKTMLETLGVWSRLEAPHAPICDMRVFGSAAAIGDDFLPSRLGFGASHATTDDQDAAPLLGHIVSLADLGRALHAALGAAIDKMQISVLEAPISGFDADTQTVQLDDDTDFKTALFVDCQRDAAWHARMAAVAHDYQAAALVGTLNGARAHENRATQIFLPDGPLALLPLPDPHQRALVWSLPTAKAAALADAAMQAETLFCHELTAATQDRLGALRPYGPFATQKLSLYLAQDFCAPHHVLLGDAAHVVHPLAGQGFNLTLRDAAALADQLHAARSLGLPLYDAALLADYARRRRADAALMVGATHGLARLFQGRLAAWARLGMGLVGTATQAHAPLRAGFVRHANGGEDLPRLMRGDAFE